MIAFAAPQYAWFLALPAGIVALYLLRRKYLPRQVPSTFLWRAAVKDHAANRPLQRLRKNLLLPVQLLAALSLSLALMQPYIPGGEASRTVMIFDLSAGMGTVSEGRTRLEEAVSRAGEVLDSLPPGEEITVLSAGAEVRRVITGSTDREDVRAALRGLRAERGGAATERAVSLAEAIRREETDRGTRIIIFSDNCRPEAGIAAMNCGRGEENRGIYALTAEEGSAYARVCNYGAACTVTLSCEADGKLCEAKTLEIPEGETAGAAFAIPEGAGTVTVRIREKDVLEADNMAEAPVVRSTARTVALTGDSLFLESALRTRKDLRVVRAAGETPAETPADLYIYGDSVLIFSRDPARNTIVWAETEKEPEGALAVSDSPMTEGMTLRGVTLRAFRPLSGGSPALRAGEETAAAFTENEAVIGFRPEDSNLPLKYDFPILIRNILKMLLPETEAETEITDPPVPREESDVRTVAPDTEAEAGAAARTRGQSLSRILLTVFLILLVLEFVLAREPWVRRRGKGDTK